MRSLNKKDVSKSLIRLSAHYPEAGLTTEKLNILADDYFDAFKAYYFEVFKRAIKACKFESTFFPKIPDVRKQCEKYDKQFKTLSLPEQSSGLTNFDRKKNRLFGIVFKDIAPINKSNAKYLEFMAEEIQGIRTEQDYKKFCVDFPELKIKE